MSAPPSRQLNPRMVTITDYRKAQIASDFRTYNSVAAIVPCTSLWLGSDRSAAATRQTIAQEWCSEGPRQC